MKMSRRKSKFQIYEFSFQFLYLYHSNPGPTVIYKLNFNLHVNLPMKQAMFYTSRPIVGFQELPGSLQKFKSGSACNLSYLPVRMLPATSNQTPFNLAKQWRNGFAHIVERLQTEEAQGSVHKDSFCTLRVIILFYLAIERMHVAP